MGESRIVAEIWAVGSMQSLVSGRGQEASPIRTGRTILTYSHLRGAETLQKTETKLIRLLRTKKLGFTQFVSGNMSLQWVCNEFAHLVKPI